MRLFPLVLAVLVLAVASTSRAVPTTMTYAGVLRDGGTPLNGSVDAAFELFAASSGGTALYTEAINGLIVLDGDVVAELGNNALDDTVLDSPELWLEVSIDGETMTPRVRLNSVPYALRAEAALRAEEALTFGGLLPTDVVTQVQLAGLGLNNGISAGAGLSKSGSTLSIATGGVVTSMIGDGQVVLAKLATSSVDSARIVNGTIVGADVATDTIAAANIAAGAVTTSEILDSTVTSADISDSTITAADLGSSSVASAELATGSITSSKLANSRHIFLVSEPGCVEVVGTVMTASTCARDTAGCSAGQCRDCNTNVCGTLNCAITFCFNDDLGFIVGP